MNGEKAPGAGTAPQAPTSASAAPASRFLATPQRAAAMRALIELLAARLVRDELGDSASDTPPPTPR